MGEPLHIDSWVGLVDKRDYAGISSFTGAINVCVTDSGNIVTRKGYTQPAPLANVHSVLVIDNIMYAVTPSNLYIVDNNLIATSIHNMGGGAHVAYATTPQGTVLTDGVSGVVINGSDAVDWVGTTGGVDAVDFMSPDTNSTRLEGVPTTPNTPCLGYGNGKLVSIVEGVAVHTFPYTITVNNPEEYIALPSEVKVVTRVNNITVLSSVDGTYLYNGESVRKVSDYEIILGSPILADGNVVGLSTSNVVVFATSGGVCFVTGDGEYKELTHENVSWYSAERASSAITLIDGSWQYVVRMSNAEPYNKSNMNNQIVVRR